MTPRFYLCIITRTQIIKWIIPSYQELFVGPKNIPRAAYFSKTDKELHPKLSLKKKFFRFDLFFNGKFHTSLYYPV